MISIESNKSMDLTFVVDDLAFCVIERKMQNMVKYLTIVWFEV